LDFGSKSQVLEKLCGKLQSASILPLIKTDWASWRAKPKDTLKQILNAQWAKQPLIVRSSSSCEDQAGASMAGAFLSVPNVTGEAQLTEAISQVFSSYGAKLADADQAFIQPFLNDLTASGVAFSRDPNTGGPYIVINYETTGDSFAVTGGKANVRTFYFWKEHANLPDGVLGDVIRLIRELESIFCTDQLDIEFGMSRSEGLCLFQVRPLRVSTAVVEKQRHRAILQSIADRVTSNSRPHPYLSGKRTVFGVMPDWNPAEIIGVRPRPLALSLYRNLITDQIWAYQRNNYGYKNLRSFPLMVSLHGLPYIDVRLSFNSFVPAEVERGLADRLVDYYIDRLLAAPSLHDKVEFEIVFSCYTFDLPDRIAALERSGFSASDIANLTDNLRHLTNRIIHRDHGLWQTDAAKIEELRSRRRQILDSDLDPVARIYWLLEDCKRWGTLPFAGLARAGFIAMQMLRSMVTIGLIDERQFDMFMAETDTVTSKMMRDLRNMNRAHFLEKYGHLRPGTYDITSLRYDEAPDTYLSGHAEEPDAGRSAQGEFRLSLTQMKRLTDLMTSHGLEMDVVGLFDFIRSAIQGREYAKFEFTRSLSDALSLLTELGASHGLSRDDLSYADISILDSLIASAGNVAETLRRSIESGRALHAETCQIALPPLIADANSVWAFELPDTQPNFITQGVVEGAVCGTEGGPNTLRNRIVFIPNADPGFDWIFTHGISGLVTAFGGVNSHMAIRAGECGVPAIIGCGEQLFNSWKNAKRLKIDCVNQRVEILQK
jgi:phosphohistidine swiveling domain-containing protein